MTWWSECEEVSVSRQDVPARLALLLTPDITLPCVDTDMLQESGMNGSAIPVLMHRGLRAARRDILAHPDPLISTNNLLPNPSNNGANEQSRYLSTNKPSLEPPIAPLLLTSLPSMTVP